MESDFNIKLLQSDFWAKHKSSFGWTPLFFKEGDHKVLVLVRRLFKAYHFAYIPYGLPLKSASKELVRKLAFFIKSSYPKLLFIRFDFSDYQTFSIAEKINLNFKFGVPLFLKKASDVQPSNTVVLPLATHSLDEILSNMHKKCRYNIKLASKKGVEVKQYIGAEALPYIQNWYDLYLVTAKRDGIAIHSFDYYKALFELALNPNYGVELSLFLASHQSDLLAGIIVVRYKNQAIYLYGASSNLKREFMPAYLLQWSAINYCKEQGDIWYDFFGIPPANDEAHPMYGLYRFKTGFGGTLVHRAGAYDYPVKAILYRLFRLIESARIFYFKVIKKR